MSKKNKKNSKKVTKQTVSVVLSGIEVALKDSLAVIELLRVTNLGKEELEMFEEELQFIKAAYKLGIRTLRDYKENTPSLTLPRVQPTQPLLEHSDPVTTPEMCSECKEPLCDCQAECGFCDNCDGKEEEEE